MSEFAVEPLAEDALLLRFGGEIAPAINARVHAVARRLRAADLPDVGEIAPAYASLLIRFDPLTWGDADETPHARLLTAIASILGDMKADPDAASASATVEIPVCYGDKFGPDLGEVSRHACLDVRECIARHAAIEYTVAMLGFAPGFPYLLGLDPALQMPRRDVPRIRVPAGSVAIGGAQTGIYPRELPGGWRIIGRTPLMLFDPGRDPPCLLAPGDGVRFRGIDENEFVALLQKRDQGRHPWSRAARPLFDSRDPG